MVQWAVNALRKFFDQISMSLRWMVGATPKQVERRMRRKGLL